MWYTADGTWTDVQEVYLDDLLLELQDAEVEGADLVEAFSGDVGHCCWIYGINNAGQIVASGIPAFATALGYSPEAGTAVFLIDTKELQILAGLPGDVNNDGAINNIGITSFIAALAAEDLFIPIPTQERVAMRLAENLCQPMIKRTGLRTDARVCLCRRVLWHDGQW